MRDATFELVVVLLHQAVNREVKSCSAVAAITSGLLKTIVFLQRKLLAQKKCRPRAQPLDINGSPPAFNLAARRSRHFRLARDKRIS